VRTICPLEMEVKRRRTAGASFMTSTQLNEFFVRALFFPAVGAGGGRRTDSAGGGGGGAAMGNGASCRVRAQAGGVAVVAGHARKDVVGRA